MNLELPNADILMKISDAKCLTEPELQTLANAIAEVRLRRDVDEVDSRWESDMKKYVNLRRSKSGKEGLFLVSREEGFTGIIVGLGLASFGGYMSWQFFQDSNKAEDSFALLPILFFAFLLAMGTWIVIKSSRQFGAVSTYEQERRDYLSKRKLLTAQLPEEARFPVRYCPNCLSQDWHKI